MNIKDACHEFTVKNVWDELKGDQELRKYLPTQEMDLGKHPDQKIFWGVVST